MVTIISKMATKNTYDKTSSDVEKLKNSNSNLCSYGESSNARELNDPADQVSQGKSAAHAYFLNFFIAIT